ncbi:MAG TPA: POTRA domain-containing protein [Saprospiraceae bacterium]|nr:POTRA domain-containing protein [Saprospiraceae bacterium]
MKKVKNTSLRSPKGGEAEVPAQLVLPSTTFKLISAQFQRPFCYPLRISSLSHSLNAFLSTIIVLCLQQFCIGQDTVLNYVVIDEVKIVGNKLTSENVIFRELDFAIKDTITLAELDARLDENEKRLLSTGLFNLADFNIKNWQVDDNHIELELKLQENWYIYPSIIFELADRSFNVWWKEENFDFSRVNYGVRLDHLNTTGHRDRLKLKFQRGYTQKYELEYKYPYLYEGWGGGLSIFYSENREIGYKTLNNKIQFRKWEDERKLLRRFRGGISLSKRNNAFLRQTLRIEIHHNTVDTVVAQELNPSYFLDGKTSITFPYFQYELIYDKRVFPTYAEGGYLLFTEIKKSGLSKTADYNNLELILGGEIYTQIVKNLFWGNRVKGKFNLIRNTLGYANNTALGYGSNSIRGYELYVMDGSDFFIAKTALRYQYYKGIINLGKWMPLKQLKQMPVALNFRFSIDGGYVNEPTYKDTNSLSNKGLIGYGPALDFMLYNNYLFSVEYNFNQIGESGLYLQSSFNF